MDIMIPIPPTEFNFDSACSTPYMSAPSSPKRFGEYYSAPTSPMRGSAIYHDFNRFGGSSVIPFGWDEKPNSRDTQNEDEDEDDFAFDFDGKLERTSLTADELFDGGKIRPLIPPTRSQQYYESTQRSPISSPRSPKSTIAQGKKMFWDAISPREMKESKNSDQTQKGSEQNRGRGRTSSVSKASNSSRRETRSLSPLRVAEFAHEEQQKQQQQQEQEPTFWNSKKSSSASSTSSSSSLKGSKKWRFSDFLLFRSASEGRAADKDPLRKYTALSKKIEDEKNSSFRSIDSTGSAASNSRRKGPLSAHEMHYKVNRAVREESTKKTYLPYKPGLLGCIGFNPTAYGLSQRL